MITDVVSSAHGAEDSLKVAFPAQPLFHEAVIDIAERAKGVLPECHDRIERAVQLLLSGEVQALLDGDLTSYQIEKRYVHASGHSLWVLLTVSIVHDNQGQPLYLISQLQDISERKELEQRLEYLVDHDFLTALFNRRHFEQALAQETKLAARYGGGGAVLLLDLDHFKDVNDRFGHKAGDDLLKTVAAALRERIRETDILARLGGDEFGIILPQADEAQTLVVADEVVKAMRRQTAMLAEQVIPVTASVGVVLFDHLTDIELLACADLAMYEAKESGRNGFSLYRCSFRPS